MRLVINIILFIITLFLIFILWKSIQEPIAFKEEFHLRKSAVVKKLEQNREAQLAFRSLKGGFAPNYDTLKQVIMEDSFEIISIIGDIDAGDKIEKKVTYVAAKDSIVDALGINLDSLMYIPYGGGKTFEVFADTLTYQKMNVPVVEVKSSYLDFMPEYNDDRYKRYDSKFAKIIDDEIPLKFGDRRKPTTSGNWEN